MRTVIVGSIQGSYGVRGWVKVHSYTEPPEGILRYRPWYLERGGHRYEHGVLEAKPHAGRLVARLGGISSPEQARELRGANILVDRTQFPPAGPGEYYRVDLLGLSVWTIEGRTLGVVKDVMETGANDVLVVQGERERLIPFIQGHTVRSIDQGRGRIVVDWDAEF